MFKITLKTAGLSRLVALPITVFNPSNYIKIKSDAADLRSSLSGQSTFSLSDLK